jgi:AraC-like DNA-binding protein
MRVSISELELETLAVEMRYNIKAIAASLQISTRQLQREINRRFGRAPQVWLTERRISAAERLLLSRKSVKTVAGELGFKQSSHFCRLFKSLNFMTPSEFVRYAGRAAECPSRITDVALR